MENRFKDNFTPSRVVEVPNKMYNFIRSQRKSFCEIYNVSLLIPPQQDHSDKITITGTLEDVLKAKEALQLILFAPTEETLPKTIEPDPYNVINTYRRKQLATADSKSRIEAQRNMPEATVEQLKTKAEAVKLDTKVKEKELLFPQSPDSSEVSALTPENDVLQTYKDEELSNLRQRVSNGLNTQEKLAQAVSAQFTQIRLLEKSLEHERMEKIAAQEALKKATEKAKAFEKEASRYRTSARKLNLSNRVLNTKVEQYENKLKEYKNDALSVSKAAKNLAVKIDKETPIP